MINSSEITVVIKGLIIGKKTDKYSDRYTYRNIESIRKFLPDSKIILSTWVGSDVSGLEPDEIIFNEDPGKLEMWSLDQKVVCHISTNNQIINSSKGLEKVTTKYSLIIRSDMVLIGKGFLKYFLKYNRNTCTGYLNKKIVVLPSPSPSRLYRDKKFFNNLDWAFFEKSFFALGDWIYFGLTDDLRNIFSISLIDKNKLHGEIINGYHLTYQNLSPEQYVWINFLRKKEDIRLSHFTYFPEDLNNKLEESYAKNTIMISASRFGVESLKYPRVGYAAKPWLSKGFYTMSEYNKIYNKYNKDKIFYIKNYFEELLYYIQIKSRYISRGSNKTRKIIVNILRMFNGMKSLD